MWFGTRDGLNKYDGYHFKTYHTDDDPNSLVANDVRSLYFDKQDNRLWVGATGGLSVYMSKTDNFINYLNDPKNPNSISSNIIRHINRDRKGRLWIGTARGLNLLDETTNKFTRYYFDSSQGLANAKNDVKAIAEDRNGDVYLQNEYRRKWIIFFRRSRFLPYGWFIRCTY